MKQILTNLKELAKDYGDGTLGTALKGIKTYKIGVLGQTIIYPVLDIQPRFETYGGMRSGRVHRIDRNIDFLIYTKSLKLQDTTNQVRELAEAVVEMFYDVSNPNNYKLTSDSTDYVFSFSPGQIQYQVQEEGDQQLQRALVPFVFSSWETGPTVTNYPTITDTGMKTLSEYIYAQLKAASTLTKVKFDYAHMTPTIQVGDGVVICVVDNYDERTRRETGRDNPNYFIDIVVWTKASPYEGTLEYNMDIVELVKDVLQSNPQLGGKAYNSKIDRIEYGINEDMFLYGSRIVFNCQTYNLMPSY